MCITTLQLLCYVILSSTGGLVWSVTLRIEVSRCLDELLSAMDPHHDKFVCPRSNV